MKFFSLNCSFILLLVSCSLTGSSPMVCNYVVLSNQSASMVVRSYSKDAIINNMEKSEAEMIIKLLPDLLAEYIRGHSQNVDSDIMMMPLLVRARHFNIQIVPILKKEKRMALFNFISLEKSPQNWRKYFYSLSDGGVDNCICLVDLEAKKLCFVKCNGHG